MAWLDSHLAPKRVDNYRQVNWRNSARRGRNIPPGQLGPTSRERDWLLRAFITYAQSICKSACIHYRIRRVTNPYFICLRDSLRDAHNQSNFILYCFDYGVSGKWWGDIEDGRVRFGLSHRLLSGRSLVWGSRWKLGQIHLANRAEDRKSQVCLASFLWRHASNHFCAIGKSFLDMKCPLWLSGFLRLYDEVALGEAHRLSGETLTEDLGIFVYKKILDGVCITLPRYRLRERPASSLEGFSRIFDCIIEDSLLHSNDWPA